jgi:hypothetical protein
VGDEDGDDAGTGVGLRLEGGLRGADNPPTAAAPQPPAATQTIASIITPTIAKDQRVIFLQGPDYQRKEGKIASVTLDPEQPYYSIEYKSGDPAEPIKTAEVEPTAILQILGQYESLGDMDLTDYDAGDPEPDSGAMDAMWR